MSDDSPTVSDTKWPRKTEGEESQDEIFQRVTKENSEKGAKLILELRKKRFEPCPDERAGMLEIGKRTATFESWIIKREQVDEKNQESSSAPSLEVRRNLENLERVICIVLESPHRREFDRSGMSQGPAFGTTGQRLDNRLASKINNFLDGSRPAKSTQSRRSSTT